MSKVFQPIDTSVLVSQDLPSLRFMIGVDGTECRKNTRNVPLPPTPLFIYLHELRLHIKYSVRAMQRILLLLIFIDSS